MVKIWDAVTFPATQVQDFRSFVAFRTETLHVEFNHWKWTDELHLATASSMEILLYYCFRHGKDKEAEWGVKTGIDRAVDGYYKSWKEAQMARRVDEVFEVVATLDVD
ncbi:hypothetical protein FKW77_003449 [Venturia effusa]|uniref:Uncharacterized protein n=1 Tax=Venturia effusa TaxID=50376 RepID=A0A517L534_9PEZI|nr:hypothetical protein FKW77_003449 [Venturia effusa]